MAGNPVILPDGSELDKGPMKGEKGAKKSPGKRPSLWDSACPEALGSLAPLSPGTPWPTSL